MSHACLRSARSNTQVNPRHSIRHIIRTCIVCSNQCMAHAYGPACHAASTHLANHEVQVFVAGVLPQGLHSHAKLLHVNCSASWSGVDARRRVLSATPGRCCCSIVSHGTRRAHNPNLPSLSYIWKAVLHISISSSSKRLANSSLMATRVVLLCFMSVAMVDDTNVYKSF